MSGTQERPTPLATRAGDANALPPRADGRSPDGNVSTADRHPLRAFNAWYGDLQAVRSVNAEIPENQVTAFIGPSGCGKSTLLRWINRMNDTVPSAHADGELTMHGLDVLAPQVDVVDLRRRVGMVFQKPNPFPSRSTIMSPSVLGCT
jgi:phosphate transport system ATP-binding protein